MQEMDFKSGNHPQLFAKIGKNGSILNTFWWKKWKKGDISFL